MRFLIVLLFIGCISPTEPTLSESSFSMSNMNMLVYDVPGGKGILLQTWVVRLDDGINNPEIIFYIYEIKNGNLILLEEIISAIQIAPSAMANNQVSKSTANIYTLDQLKTITIGMGIK